VLNPELWGNLRERYAQKRPRKLLALDGGGIRGVLTLQILGRIEELLASASGAGSSFRLCDYFDYIGGTSTGAIIAAGLPVACRWGNPLTSIVQWGRRCSNILDPSCRKGGSA